MLLGIPKILVHLRTLQRVEIRPVLFDIIYSLHIDIN